MKKILIIGFIIIFNTSLFAQQKLLGINRDSIFYSKYNFNASSYRSDSYICVGLFDKAAMTVSQIDSNSRTTVHLNLKSIVWVNDSTFYIQHKKLHLTTN